MMLTQVLSPPGIGLVHSLAEEEAQMFVNKILNLNPEAFKFARAGLFSEGKKKNPLTLKSLSLPINTWKY